MKMEPRTTALLLVDVINDFDFEGSSTLIKAALPVARNLARLKARLKKKGIPAIYVNDNFGRWQSNFPDQVRRCLEPQCAGKEVASLLLPEEDDYFVLKPKHSGFYSTALQVLLGELGIKTLILTGFAGDICVLYTANDAYMRDYSLVVPSDCSASETSSGQKSAIEHMRYRLKAKVTTARSLR